MNHTVAYYGEGNAAVEHGPHREADRAEGPGVPSLARHYRSQGIREWFKVELGSPFIPGKTTLGRITHPGYENLVMEVFVESMEPERFFSFRWHPYAIDPNVDYSGEQATLVEFRFEPTPAGTLLVVSESGFDALPAARRDEAFRMNERGWTGQLKNIERHVASKP